MAEEPKLVCVRRCYGLDVANIYRSKLEAAGIPVMLQYDSVGPVFGITIDGLGEVRIMVPEDYATEAESLLVDRSDEELAELQSWDEQNDTELEDESPPADPGLPDD